MQSTDQARLRELRSFLQTCRANVTPSSLGIESAGRRRVAGLRREELADLVGVSELHYKRFETGQRAFSLETLGRLADALKLTGVRRHRLFELALPGAHAAINGSPDGRLPAGLGSSVAEFRRMLRRCSAATTLAELSQSACDALHVLGGPTSSVYFHEFTDDASSTFSAAAGSIAEHLIGYVQNNDALPYAMQTMYAGGSIGELDLRVSPSAELRARVDAMDVLAYYAQPLSTDIENDRCDAAIGWTWSETRVPTELEVTALAAAATLVESLV